MLKIVIILISIFGYALELDAFTKDSTIKIQKPGKTDICNIGAIDDGDTFDLNCIG